MVDRLSDDPWTSPEHRQLDTHNVERHAMQITDSLRPNYNLITGKCSKALTSNPDTFSVTQTGAGSSIIVSEASTSLTGQTVSTFCGKTLVVTSSAAATVTITQELSSDGTGSGTALFTLVFGAAGHTIIPLGMGAAVKAGDIFENGVNYKLSVTTTAGNATVSISGVSLF